MFGRDYEKRLDLDAEFVKYKEEKIKEIDESLVLEDKSDLLKKIESLMESEFKNLKKREENKSSFAETFASREYMDVAELFAPDDGTDTFLKDSSFGAVEEADGDYNWMGRGEGSPMSTLSNASPTIFTPSVTMSRADYDKNTIWDEFTSNVDIKIADLIRSYNKPKP